MIYLLCKYDIRTRPANEIKDFERVPRNLVIRCAHNNIRSFICRRHISSHDSAISYRRYITRSARNGYHCKKPLLSGRQKRFFTPFDSLHLCSPKAKKSRRLFWGLSAVIWRRESPLSFAAYRGAPLRSRRFVRSPVAKKQFPELFFYALRFPPSL